MKAKCSNPSCDNIFDMADIHYRGGINDKGGLIVKCCKCGHFSAIVAENPEEHFGMDGGTIEDRWEDEYPADYFNFKYKIKGFGEKLMIEADAISSNKPVWNSAPYPFYANDFNYEEEAYRQLLQNAGAINDAFRVYSNYYLKGKDTVEKSFIVINYPNSSRNYQAIFSKQIDNEGDLCVEGLYLIHHSDMDLEKRIDGIYTRNEAIVFLERCLNRWSTMCNEIIIATPFIGFNFNKKQKEEVVELWNWLDVNTNMKKTHFVTRKATFTLLKQSQNQEEVTFDVLKEWGLLGDLQNTGTNGEMNFFQKFHAKFYAGIFSDRVEMLSGSFNIHTGEFLENLTFRTYDKLHFKENYIRKIAPSFDYKESTVERIFYIEVNIDGTTQYNTMDLNEFMKKQSINI
ncbi:hypothetical protein DW228_16740 [Bacteroides fragilis]|uniref:Uncharacterized protein n=2 Tax=Bacteroides fragilis TaxID=817 RepID=A0A396BQP9_BACFG|nr:hypothetical protein DW228_16740 [Bacteroides fragilis]